MTKAILQLIGALLLFALMAFPVKWLINDLFTPGMLAAVFGGPINWATAFGLCLLGKLLS